MKVNLALAGLPKFSCLPEGSPSPFGSTIHLLPGSPGWPTGRRCADGRAAAMWADVQAGRLPAEPTIEWYVHTTVDPSLQDDAGHHSSALFVQSVPYGSTADLGGELPGYVDALLAICDRYAPGTSRLVVDTLPLTPPGIEQHFGITGGHIHHVDNTVAFDERMPYATGLDGLYAGAPAATRPAASSAPPDTTPAKRDPRRPPGRLTDVHARSAPAGAARAGDGCARDGRPRAGRARSWWPTLVRQRPLGRSNFQPCSWQVSALPSTMPKRRQVRLQMRAAPLHRPVAQLMSSASGWLVLVVPALGVLQALLGQALEERVDELVVLPDPGRREAAGQEERVDPVDLVDVEQVLDQRPLGPEPVADLLVGVRRGPACPGSRPRSTRRCSPS